MSLSTDEEIPGPIPGSSVGFSSNGEFFHGMYELYVLVYVVLSSEEALHFADNK